MTKRLKTLKDYPGANGFRWPELEDGTYVNLGMYTDAGSDWIEGRDITLQAELVCLIPDLWRPRTR